MYASSQSHAALRLHTHLERCKAASREATGKDLVQEVDDTGAGCRA